MSKKGGVVILPKLTESSLQNKGRYALLPLPLPPISRTQEYSEPLLEVRNDHTPLPPIHSKQGVRAIPAVSIEAAESSEPLLAIGNDNTPLPPISRTADSIKADEPSEPLLESENDYTLLQKEVTSLINNSEEELLKLKKKQNAYKKALDRANAIATEEKLQSMIDRIDNIIPIETKSGKTGALRSLHQFMDEAPHHMAVRFYNGEITISEVKTPLNKTYFLLNLPYYLVSQLNEYLKWFEKQISGKTKK
jgi:hypothetical protein